MGGGGRVGSKISAEEKPVRQHFFLSCLLSLASSAAPPPLGSQLVATEKKLFPGMPDHTSQPTTNKHTIGARHLHETQAPARAILDSQKKKKKAKSYSTPKPIGL